MESHDRSSNRLDSDIAAQRRALLAGAAGVAAGAFLARPSIAGDLNPPAGPIAPTMKPLDEVEPRIAINAQNTPGDLSSVYRITQPGSYYLTEPLMGVSGRNGISIETGSVTIDLNGFTVQGVPGSLAGVRTTLSLSRIVVRNGIVRSWGGAGVDLNAGGQGSGGMIENVVSTLNGGVGIGANINSIVRECVAFSNGGDGVFTAQGSVISRCVSRLNTQRGYFVGPGSVIRECVAESNSGDAGIAADPDCVVSDCCVAFNISGEGIRATSRCLIRGNQCSNNGSAGGGASGAGIRVTSFGNRIEENNWMIAANNVCLVFNATLSGAFTGNSGGSSPGTTNSWANFTY